MKYAKASFFVGIMVLLWGAKIGDAADKPASPFNPFSPPPAASPAVKPPAQASPVAPQPASSPADISPPQITLVSPEEGFAVLAGGKLTLIGRVTDDVGLKTIRIFNTKEYVEYSVSGKEIDLSRYPVNLPQYLSAGINTIGVYAYDQSGKNSQKLVSVVSGIRKAVSQVVGAPVVNLTSPTLLQVVAGSVRLAGTVTDASGLKSITISNGVTNKQYAVSGKTLNLANYTVDFPSMAGSATVMVNAYNILDQYGYMFTSVNIPGPGDRYNPVVTIQSPLKGETISGVSEIRMRGSVTDDLGLKSFDINTNTAGCTDLPFKIARYNVSGKMVDLSNYPIDISHIKGSFNLAVGAEDAIGRKEIAVVNINVIPPPDRNAPVINLAFPKLDQAIQAGIVKFQGTVTDDVNLSLLAVIDPAALNVQGEKKGKVYRICGKKVDLSNFSVDLTKIRGPVTFAMEAQDASGKRSTMIYLRLNVLAPPTR